MKRVKPVSVHLSCRRCGYDLHTLESNKQCPECGLPIQFSLSASRTAADDPVWAKHMIQSLDAMLLATGLFTISAILLLSGLSWLAFSGALGATLLLSASIIRSSVIHESGTSITKWYKILNFVIILSCLCILLLFIFKNKGYGHIDAFVSCLLNSSLSLSTTGMILRLSEISRIIHLTSISKYCKWVSACSAAVGISTTTVMVFLNYIINPFSFQDGQYPLLMIIILFLMIIIPANIIAIIVLLIIIRTAHTKIVWSVRRF